MTTHYDDVHIGEIDHDEYIPDLNVGEIFADAGGYEWVVTEIEINNNSEKDVWVAPYHEDEDEGGCMDMSDDDDELTTYPPNKETIDYWIDIKVDNDVILPLTDSSWKKFYPTVKEHEIDPVVMVSDIYLLFGVSSGSLFGQVRNTLPDAQSIIDAASLLGIHKNLTDMRIEENRTLLEASPVAKLVALQETAGDLFAETVEKYFTPMHDYLLMVCGGELRHAGTMYGASARRIAWAVYKVLWEKYGVALLRYTEEVFMKCFPPNSAYGGAAWAAGARLLIDYHEGKLGNGITGKYMFLDRLVTMEHNTGAMLNKLSWSNHRLGRSVEANYNWHNMRDEGKVLECHAGTPTNIAGLHSTASEPVQDLVSSVMSLALECGVTINGKWAQTNTVESVTVAPKSSKVFTKLDWDNVPDTFFEKETEPDEVDVSECVVTSNGVTVPTDPWAEVKKSIDGTKHLLDGINVGYYL